VKAAVVVATVAAFPPTLAAILGYLANSRSLRRSIGEPSGIPLTTVVQRLDEKVDRLVEGQAATRERLARLEGPGARLGARSRTRSGRA
jgi:hypothetical protein